MPEGTLIIIKEHVKKSRLPPQNDNETWVEIDDRYKISNLGRVFSCRTGVILSVYKNSVRLKYRRMSGKPIMETKNLAKLMLKIFDKKYKGEKVIYLDGDRTNCNIDNLDY